MVRRHNELISKLVSIAVAIKLGNYSLVEGLKSVAFAKWIMARGWGLSKTPNPDALGDQFRRGFDLRMHRIGKSKITDPKVLPHMMLG